MSLHAYSVLTDGKERREVKVWSVWWPVVVPTATHSTNWEGSVRLVESEMFELGMLKKNANER